MIILDPGYMTFFIWTYLKECEIFFPELKSTKSEINIEYDESIYDNQ